MGIKIVDYRSVRFKPSTSSAGSTGGAVRAEIGAVFDSKDSPNAWVGLERLHDYHGELAYEGFDQMFYVIDGEGSVTCDGKTRQFYKGDMVLITEGSVVYWDVPGHMSMVSIVHPPADGILTTRPELRAER